MAARIRELADAKNSLRQTASVIEKEFGKKLEPSTIKRHLDKAPKAKPKAAPPVVESLVEEQDQDEVTQLRANARRLREAIASADSTRDLTLLAAELRKTLAAIRDARTATVVGDEAATQQAEALRERLAAWLPPSPPTHAETLTDAAGPALPDEPRSAVGGGTPSAT